MDKEEDKKELNRREFFKCCAKAALPIIGGVLLSKTKAVARALETVDCNNSCSNSCRTSCKSSCMSTCRNACTGCSYTCSGTCKNSCRTGCSSNCQNTSKAEPENKDTICQKTDTIRRKSSK